MSKIILLSFVPVVLANLFQSYPNFIRTHHLDDDYSNTHAIEDIRLPWQLQIFRKFIEKHNDPLDVHSSQEVTPMDHQLHLKSLLQALQRSQQSFIFYSRISTFALVTFWIFRRISQWYQHIAEYELLLDQIDIEYHQFGTPLRDSVDILTSEMSSLSTTTKMQYHYSSIASFISSSLQTACFPLKYLDYSNSLSKDVNKVLLEIEKLNRISKRKHKLMTHANGFEASQEINELTKLHRVFQKSLLVLQSRQIETALRALLNNLLSSVNICEDLQQHWKFVLQSNSQPRRLPYSKEQLHHQIRKFSFQSQIRIRRLVMFIQNISQKIRNRFHRDNQRNDDVEVMGEFKEKSVKEKLLLLEPMNNQLYYWIGIIQDHLFKLSIYRNKILEKSQVLIEDEEELSQWIEQGMSIGSSSVSKLYLHDKHSPNQYTSLPHSYARYEHLDDFILTNQYSCSDFKFQQLIDDTLRDDNTLSISSIEIAPYDSNVINETIFRSRIFIGNNFIIEKFFICTLR